MVPADPVGVNELLPQVAAWEGPVFFRLCRNEVPVIFGDQYKPQIGKGIVLREGTDLTVIGCGVMVARCLEVTKQSAAAGTDARVVEMHTIKPLDRELVARLVTDGIT